MATNKQKQLGPRADEKTISWLIGLFGTANAGAEYLMGAVPGLYARTMQEISGQFSRSELGLIIDIHNATALLPQLSGQHILASVTDAIDLDQAAEKWKIDGAALVAKLTGLPIFTRSCLEIWARGFWESGSWEQAEEMNKWMDVLN
jgi:hypothetical protein